MLKNQKQSIHMRDTTEVDNIREFHNSFYSITPTRYFKIWIPSTHQLIVLPLYTFPQSKASIEGIFASFVVVHHQQDILKYGFQVLIN
jgi:hypothetical protein